MKILRISVIAAIAALSTPASAWTPEGRACVASVTGGKYTPEDWEARTIPSTYAPRIRSCLAKVKVMYDKKRASGN